MENKQPHFSIASIKPSLTSLESSVSKLMDSAGGTQAVLEDAMGLIQKAMSSDNVPLSLVEEVIKLLAHQITTQAKG